MEDRCRATEISALDSPCVEDFVEGGTGVDVKDGFTAGGEDFVDFVLEANEWE